MKKNRIKLSLDILMLVAIALCYEPHTISLHIHEVGGLWLCGVILLHLALNAPWIQAIPKRLFQTGLPRELRIGIVVNALLILCFFLIGLSGLLISKTIFTGLSGSAAFWKPLHACAAALTIPLLGIHLGLHLDFLKGMFRKWIQVPRCVSAILVPLCLVATVTFGAYSLVTSSVTQWLMQPFHSLSQQDDRPSSGGNGMGARQGEGKGNGMKQGMGRGEGVGQGRSNDFDLSNALFQLATFGSMILTCAVATVAVRQLPKRKQLPA